MHDVLVIDYNVSNRNAEFSSWNLYSLHNNADKNQEKSEAKILFTKDRMDTVIDRFGEDVYVEIVGENHFRIKAEAVPDINFFVWIFEMGENAMIEYPLKIAAQRMDILQDSFYVIEYCP